METIDFNEVIRDPETISVVGGLLKSSTDFVGFIKQSSLTNNNSIEITSSSPADIFNMLNAGVYTIQRKNWLDDGLIDAPPINYGVLIHFQALYSCQIAIQFDSNGFYTRGNSSDNWSKWVKVSTTNLSSVLGTDV